MYRLPLFDHRVIDLADGRGALAARLLGNMGAEVIKLEPPSGDSLRGSGEFGALNVNKYSCVTESGTYPGLALRLAALSDVVIGPAGEIDAGEFRRANDALVVVLLPPNAGPQGAVAAAGAVGLALWDRRRTGLGGVIEVHAASSEVVANPSAPAATEPVSSVDGLRDVPSLPWHLSETPAHIRLPAPALGEHNRYVLGSLLGEAEAD